MIRFIDKLFLTEKTVKKAEKIKNDINNGKYISLACLITLSANDSDVFDIIPVLNFKIRRDVYDNITVLGIAENNRSAIRLCSKMAVHYFNTDMSMTMREYFANLN